MANYNIKMNQGYKLKIDELLLDECGVNDLTAIVMDIANSLIADNSLKNTILIDWFKNKTLFVTFVPATKTIYFHTKKTQEAKRKALASSYNFKEKACKRITAFCRKWLYINQ